MSVSFFMHLCPATMLQTYEDTQGGVMGGGQRGLRLRHTDSDGPEPRRDGHTCTSCPGVLCLTTESPQVHPAGREPEGDPPRPERPQPGDPQPRGPVSSGTQEGGACR